MSEQGFQRRSLSRRAMLRSAGGAGLIGAGLAMGRSPRRSHARQTQWQGTITFFAQAYTPNSQLENAIQLKAFQEVADEYQQSHPGVTIQFINEDFPDYAQTVRVKSAGRELWDVYWAQWGELNGTFPQGIARDLTEDFAKPNPYIEGGAPWQEAMNQTVVNETVAPNGAHYHVNGDYVGTAFFFNTTLFQQAGITEAPTDWPTLLAASQKLKDAGIPAATGIPDYGWFQRHFLTDFYANDYQTIAGCDGSPAISALDEAAAIEQGMLSTEDPRFMAWWPLYKQLTDFWVQDYISQPLETAAEQMRNDFVASKAAMFYSGSWTPNELKELNIEFDLDSFSFPTLTTDDSEHSTGTDTAGAVGGPNAAYQYAMATPESNQTMEEPGKTEAVLDWLHFIGTPRVIEKVANELGSFAPTWPGTKPAAGLETFAEQANNELNSVWVGNSSPQLGSSLQRTFGLFLSGNADIEAASRDVQRELDRAAQDYARTNSVDLTQCR